MDSHPNHLLSVSDKDNPPEMDKIDKTEEIRETRRGPPFLGRKTRFIVSRSKSECEILSRDKPKISHATKYPVTKTYVKNLDLTAVRPQRGGVIIYTVKDDAVYIGLGLDSNSHDLTDFGGGMIYKTDNDVVHGALREFHEETLGIFQDVNPKNITECPVVYDKNNLIIFIHLSIDPDIASRTFNEKFSEQTSRVEVCGITWLTWENFQNIIRTTGESPMFVRVQRFLNRVGDFAYLL